MDCDAPNQPTFVETKSLQEPRLVRVFICVAGRYNNGSLEQLVDSFDPNWRSLPNEVYPLHVAIYLSSLLTGLPLQEVVTHLGTQKSLVVDAIKRIEAKCNRDTSFNTEISSLSQSTYETIIGGRIALEDITNSVLRQFKMTKTNLVGSSRNREVARPRQIVMYLARMLTRRSFPEIAQHLRREDHTTVISGVKTIRRLRGFDPDLDRNIQRIMLSLNSANLG